MIHLQETATILTPPPGTTLAGSSWILQFWFRDLTSPGGGGFNLAQGPSVPLLR